MYLFSILYLLFSAELNITPDDPRWIGAWWGGFLLCGALLFFSSIFMFGFPQSLPCKEVEGVLEIEQAMLPSSLPQDYEKSKTSNGVLQNHQPNSNSLSCCQQLRGHYTQLNNQIHLMLYALILRLVCFIWIRLHLSLKDKKKCLWQTLMVVFVLNSMHMLNWRLGLLEIRLTVTV